MSKRRSGVDWGAIRHEIVRSLVAAGFPASSAVDGRIRVLEHGLSHRNYGFNIDTGGVDEGLEAEAYIYRKLKFDHLHDSDEEALASVTREGLTLQVLEDVDLPFSVPTFVCFNRDRPPTGFIESWEYGVSLEHSKRSPVRRDRLICSIGTVAAGVHGLLSEQFPHLPKWSTRRSHVLHEVGEYPQAFLEERPAAHRGIEWVKVHLPPEEPSSVLHGDLLPQNILWDFDDDQLTLVDWEFARVGDPAYDLAIVTRGARLSGDTSMMNSAGSTSASLCAASLMASSQLTCLGRSPGWTNGWSIRSK